jgi:hypothetical protein
MLILKPATVYRVRPTYSLASALAHKSISTVTFVETIYQAFLDHSLLQGDVRQKSLLPKSITSKSNLIATTGWRVPGKGQSHAIYLFQKTSIP